MQTPPYERPVGALLRARLKEGPRFIQILAGPRQCGKTTLVEQIVSEREAASCRLYRADAESAQAASDFSAPTRPVGTQGWLRDIWRHARKLAGDWSKLSPHASRTPFLLVIDEIQIVPQWSTVVKGLWDDMRPAGVDMHVLLLGSSPLLMQKGLAESLAGRFELIRATHWSFAEMNEAFGVSVDEFVYFGGYPGSAERFRDQTRWRVYVQGSLIEPSIAKDVLAMGRVDNVELLRRLFELGSRYSAQELALIKIRGELGGHTNTLADHLVLLRQASLLSGIQKYAGQVVRQRSSAPKFQVHNNALFTANATYSFEDAQADRSHWGRLVESAVGAHLINSAAADTKVFYWRDGDFEVDYVVEHRGKLVAIEVKSAAKTTSHRGLDEFCRRNPGAMRLLVGTPALPLGEFLRSELDSWFERRS